MNWIIAAIVIAAAMGGGWWLEQSAESDARSFCGRVAVGSDFAAVESAARTVGEDRLRLLGKDTVMIGFTGIPPFSRHACEVRAENGKVVAVEYLYLD